MAVRAVATIASVLLLYSSFVAIITQSSIVLAVSPERGDRRCLPEGNPPLRGPSCPVLLSPRGGRCGPDYMLNCSNQCCSDKFYCGNEEQHCLLKGCLPKWGVCGKEHAFLKPTVELGKRKKRKDGNSTEIPPDANAMCGPEYDAFCKPPFCCSKYGYCGFAYEYCAIVEKCQEGWGECVDCAVRSAPTGSILQQVQECQSNDTGGPRTPQLPPYQIAIIVFSSCTATVGICTSIYRIYWQRYRKQQWPSVRSNRGFLPSLSSSFKNLLTRSDTSLPRSSATASSTSDSARNLG